MTDVAVGGMPPELVPFVPPAPEAAAEVEAALPDAALEPALAETPAAAEASAPASAAELAHQNGSTSAAVLDHFVDSAEGGDQSIAQIIAGLGGTVSRNTIESAVRRLHEAGRLLRVSPGTYRLAPPRPPEAAMPAPAPEPVRSGDMSEAAWMNAPEAYFVDSSTWNELELGPPPTEVDNRIPQAVKVRMNDRLRKRDERRRDREAAIAKQAAADDALRNRLVAGCFNNAMPGPGIQDMAPVKAMIADGVPMEHILIGLKRRCDRRIDPQAPPLASWREEKFLIEVARSALLGGLLPRVVEAWSKAGIAPQKAADALEPSAPTQGARSAEKRTSDAAGERQRSSWRRRARFAGCRLVAAVRQGAFAGSAGRGTRRS